MTHQRIEYDILIVGGGVASLSAAHTIVDRALDKNVPLRIAVLEKGKDFGAHALSGAVSNPRSVKKLFPEYESNGFPLEGVCRESFVTLLGHEAAWDIPSLFSPPEMNKQNYLILSTSDVARWMATTLEEKVQDHPSVVVDLYRGFPAMEIVYEGNRVVGARVDNTGDPALDNCYANLTLFGDKGFLSQDLIKKFDLSPSSQTWAVGVKEIWETKSDYAGKVWHTLGYPLLDGTFGGGFIYGLKENRIAIGMVSGLDADNPNLRPPEILQALKKHPFVQDMIRGGKVLKYGAALIPEAGYYSLPKSFAVDGAMIVGDALGVMDVRGFSGVDKAMESGITAGETAFEAVQENDYSAGQLGGFKQKLMDGWVGKELYESRYYRHSFSLNKQLFESDFPRLCSWMDKVGPYVGGALAFVQSPSMLTRLVSLNGTMYGGRDLGPIKLNNDRMHNRADYRKTEKKEPEGYSKNTVYSTADVVFYATTHYHEGNAHIDEFDAEKCRACIKKYESYGNDVPCVGDCTAEVHEVRESDGARIHAMNFENCVQCRTCEIVCPEANLRVNPSAHGSGPDFSGM